MTSHATKEGENLAVERRVGGHEQLPPRADDPVHGRPSGDGRILRLEVRLAQVKQVAALLRDLGAAVNASTGLHVHCGIHSVVGHDYSAVAESKDELVDDDAEDDSTLPPAPTNLSQAR